MDYKYTLVRYVFSQREVVKALGVPIRGKFPVIRVLCDGDNKVMVEVMKGSRYVRKFKPRASQEEV